MIEKTGDRTFCTKCGQAVAECRCEKNNDSEEKVCNTCIHPCKATGKRDSCQLYDSGERMTYENFIKKYFPNTYANKDKVCIYCHQEIRCEKNEYEEPKPEITEEYCTFKNGVCIKRNITEKIRYYPRSKITEATLAELKEEIKRYREALNYAYHAIRSEESIMGKLSYHIKRAYDKIEKILEESAHFLKEKGV